MTDTLFPLTISDTQLSSLAECPMRFFRKHIEHWKGAKEEKSIHLIAGAALAKGLEVSRKAFWLENYTIDQAVSYGLDALMEELDFSGYKFQPSDLKSPERLKLAYSQSHKQFPMDGDDFEPVTFADGTRGIEIKFAIELPVLHPETNLPIIFKGKLDQLIKHNRLGHFYTFDDKTASSVSRNQDGTPDVNKTRNKYLMASQHIGYNYIARSLGVETKGTFIREYCFSKTKGVEIYNIPDCNYSKFLIDSWFHSLCSRLEYLKSIYLLYLKDKQSSGLEKPEMFFSPTFKDDCTFFATPCEFMAACQQPYGINTLKSSMVQTVYDVDSQEMRDISQMKQLLGI